MKRIILLIAFFATLNVQAQFDLDDTQTLNYLINDVLLGGGVIVENETFNGQSVLNQENQIGIFEITATGEFPLNDGLVMSSGSIFGSLGPNDSSGNTTAVSQQLNDDADLEVLAGFSVNDIAVLEFDFIPENESLIFQYVFGSEEYPEFVGSSFNDAFAFFVSGPGISGPFSSPSGFPNGAMNVAMIPSTNENVSINNVNSTMNSSFYVDNTGTSDPNHSQYDGYTIELPINFNVVPNEIYHIKIIVGDAADGIFDSGIFIKKQSFASVSATTSLAEISLENKMLIPNPVNNQLSVLAKSQVLINGVTIYDLSGKIVEDQKFNSFTSIQIDISGLDAGIYSVAILTNEGYLTKKIVKE